MFSTVEMPMWLALCSMTDNQRCPMEASASPLSDSWFTLSIPPCFLLPAAQTQVGAGGDLGWKPCVVREEWLRVPEASCPQPATRTRSLLPLWPASSERNVSNLIFLPPPGSNHAELVVMCWMNPKISWVWALPPVSPPSSCLSGKLCWCSVHLASPT